VVAEIQAPLQRPSRRRRWRSLLALSLLATVLTFVGLALSPGGLQLLTEPFSSRQGLLSDADLRQIDEIKKLGGEAHILEWTPRFLGLFGGHGLLTISFHGKSFDDAALAQFVRTYGDRVSRLYLSNTGLTDAGLRHLAGLPYLQYLAIGNIDLPRHVRPGTTLPLNTVTDAGLVHLKGLTSLRDLNLGGLPVTDVGLDTVKDLPNLGALYLDRTRVLGPGLGRLKSLPGLAVLYLDGSAVTDGGLSHLKGAKNLQFLSLAGIPLTGRGLTHLKTLPKLNRLDINGCGLGFEDLSDFQVARPAVKLE
jgi:hypothetical protein